jgi:hypothetical protein
MCIDIPREVERNDVDATGEFAKNYPNIHWINFEEPRQTHLELMRETKMVRLESLRGRALVQPKPMKALRSL